jgi:hypothetical protein
MPVAQGWSTSIRPSRHIQKVPLSKAGNLRAFSSYPQTSSGETLSPLDGHSLGQQYAPWSECLSRIWSSNSHSLSWRNDGQIRYFPYWRFPFSELFSYLWLKMSFNEIREEEQMVKGEDNDQLLSTSSWLWASTNVVPFIGQMCNLSFRHRRRFFIWKSS